MFEISAKENSEEVGVRRGKTILEKRGDYILSLKAKDSSQLSDIESAELAAYEEFPFLENKSARTLKAAELATKELLKKPLSPKEKAELKGFREFHDHDNYAYQISLVVDGELGLLGPKGTAELNATRKGIKEFSESRKYCVNLVVKEELGIADEQQLEELKLFREIEETLPELANSKVYKNLLDKKAKGEKVNEEFMALQQCILINHSCNILRPHSVK